MKCNLVIRAVAIAGLLAASAASMVAGTPVHLSFRDTTIASGRSLSYPIYVDSSLSGYSVRSYQIQFTYNRTYFTFVGATNAGTIDSTWGLPTVNEVAPGTVNIAAAGSDTLAGTGKLVILNFTSNLFTSIYNYNEYGNFTIQAGAYTLVNQGFPTLSFRTGTVTLTPGPSIAVSPNTALLTKGDVVNFSATGGHLPYAWSSTSPSVASINSLGNLTALSAGFTKVVAVDSNGYVDTSGTVEVRAYKLSFRDTSCYQGQTIDVPLNCTDLTGLGITSGQLNVTFDQNRWSVLTTTVTGGILSSYGPATFTVGSGTLSISFAGSSPLTGSGVLLYVRMKASSTNYGGTSLAVQNGLFNQNLVANVGTANLNNIQLAPVTVSPAYAQTLVVGDSIQFSASGGTPPYTWLVSGSGLATISQTGWLKATRSGRDTVRATDVLGSVGKGGPVSIYDFRMSVPDTSLIPSSFVDVPIFVSPNTTGFSSFQFSLTYTTSTYVQLDSIVTSGTLSNGMTPAYSFTPGGATIAFAGTSKISAGGTLVKLRFGVPDSTPRPSTTYINITTAMFNEGIPLPFVKNGSFQIANRAIIGVTPTSASLHTTVGHIDSATFTVSNTGTANLTSSISVIGSSVFTLSTSNINVAPAGNTTVTVYYQPVTAGVSSATVRFTTNDPYHNPVNIPVSGATPYPILAFSVPSLSFGSSSVGHYKDTTIVISNTGTDTLRITNIVGSLPVFTARPTTGTIAPGQTMVDTLRFTPSVGGTIAGRISVTSNSLTTPDTLGVSGSGGAITPILTLSNSVFSFGIVSITGFKDTVVTISNNGSDTLKITSMSSSNGVFAARPVTRVVSPGQSFPDTLRFSPSAVGGYSGRIFIVSNAPSSPDTITVSGTGHAPFPILLLSVSTVNFGSVKVGSFKDTVITVSNSGTDTLKISSITTGNIVFSSRPATRTVLPGQLFSDTLRFTPAAAGGYSAKVYFTSNALTTPDTISVSGTGTPGTDVSDPSRLPEAYSLGQNFPNPFNPSTIITYGLRARSTVHLVVYNILGQKVDELVNGEESIGVHSVTWNPTVPSGAYFYRIDATSTDDPSDHFTQIRKMILMK